MASRAVRACGGPAALFRAIAAAHVRGRCGRRAVGASPRLPRTRRDYGTLAHPAVQERGAVDGTDAAVQNGGESAGMATGAHVRITLPSADDVAAFEAVTAEEFANAANACGLARTDRVAIAVSGGVDSMALALLAAAHFKHVHTFTFDHGFRAESAAEATLVREWLAKRGIDGDVITLDWGEKGPPKTRVQLAARVARYSRLTQECARRGISCLLSAHQLGDQVETTAMRLMRESNIEGLAGIRRVSTCAEYGHPNIRLVRPLLDFRKERLVATCVQHRQPWAEDPSNSRDDYYRNRVRAAIAEMGEEGLEALRTINAAAARAAEELAEAARTACYETLRLSKRHGFAEIDLEAFSRLSPEVARRVAALAFTSIGASIKGVPPSVAAELQKGHVPSNGLVAAGAIAVDVSHKLAGIPIKALLVTPTEDLEVCPSPADGPFYPLPLFASMGMPHEVETRRFPGGVSAARPRTALLARHVHAQLVKTERVPLRAEALDPAVGFHWENAWLIRIVRRSSWWEGETDDVHAVGGVVHARGRPLFVEQLQRHLNSLASHLLFIRAPKLAAAALPCVVDDAGNVVAVPDIRACQLVGHAVLATFVSRRPFPDCPLIEPTKATGRAPLFGSGFRPLFGGGGGKGGGKKNARQSSRKPLFEDF